MRKLLYPSDLRYIDPELIRTEAERLRRVVETIEQQADYLALWDRYEVARARLSALGHSDLLPRED